LGFLKIGYRKLFHYDSSGKIRELNPLCVLDFYVHESVQRGGVGKVNNHNNYWYLVIIWKDDRKHKNLAKYDCIWQAF